MILISMAAAAAAAVAPVRAPPTPVAEPSAAQRLFSSAETIWTNLSHLRPDEVALNLGLSVLVVLALCIAIWILRRLLHAGVRKLQASDTSVAPAEPVHRDSTAELNGPPQAARITWHLARGALAAIAALILLSIWGLDLVGWLTTSGTGAVLMRLTGVVLIAVILIEVAGNLVDRLLGLLTRHASPGRRAAQVKTLGPLIRGVLQGFIVILASLTVLSELGVKIGALLASAGVVGVAVGFGAQTLVKDFLTGLFLVVEDIVAVGDNVRIGDKTGTVEAMTLRTIRVRNMDGTLHILPYSEAQVISNRTKTYSAYIFDIGIGYGDDIEKAFAVMRRVGDQMQAEPELTAKILQPLEIMGIDQFADSAVMLKARFRTAPGEQWNVGREFNRRIKSAFDAEGIDLPYPHRKLILASPAPQQAASDTPPTQHAPGDDAVNDPE